MADVQLCFPCTAQAYEIDDIDDEIGQGTAATVYRAFCHPLLLDVAVKVVDLELSERPLDELAAEAALLRQLRHPHLMPLHCSFVAGSQLWLVSPLASGDLASLMAGSYPRGLPEPLIATLARDVLSALDYLHRQAGVTHRDVKAANVLVDDSGRALLADLGAAASSRGSSDAFELSSSDGSGGDGSGCDGSSHGAASPRQHTDFAGSPCWMAPEVAAGDPYDWHADIWSFGITLIELAQGKPPFHNLPQRELWTQLAHGAPPLLANGEGRLYSQNLRDLVARCLMRKPQRRPSAAQLLEHRLFSRVASRADVRAQLLGLAPSGSQLRGTASLPAVLGSGGGGDGTERGGARSLLSRPLARFWHTSGSPP